MVGQRTNNTGEEIDDVDIASTFKKNTDFERKRQVKASVTLRIQDNCWEPYL